MLLEYKQGLYGLAGLASSRSCWDVDAWTLTEHKARRENNGENASVASHSASPPALLYPVVYSSEHRSVPLSLPVYLDV